MLQINTSKMQSLCLSKKRGSTSKQSNTLLTPSTSMMRKSSGSTKSQRSRMMRTGEHSHGDPSQIGNRSESGHHRHCCQATEPATTRRRMNLTPQWQLDQLECMGSMSDTVNDPEPKTSMIHEMLKKQYWNMVTTPMLITTRTNICYGEQALNRSQCYNMVWTPTLCIPDTLDRPGYFVVTYLI